MAIDKTLYPMRTKIAFKQYNPMKPAKVFSQSMKTEGRMEGEEAPNRGRGTGGNQGREG